MAQSDTKNFLIDLLTRFDPNLDTTEGSRAQAELIDPILARIGGDPFDDDIVTFIRTRLQQVRPDLAITEADELTDLLIDPMRVLIEPLTREVQLVKLRTSLANISALSDDEVDALMANFFEARKSGGYAVGVCRIYFAAPQNVSVTLVHVAQSRGGQRFLVPRSQVITADQMLLNIEGSEYYFDVNYIAENRGDEYNVERGEINSISNLQSATRVTNPRRFTDGMAREDSATYVARVQQGSSDKTLTTSPGIIAVLNENFPAVRQLFEIGYGDPEMKRDILTGGSLGSIPADDDLGSFFGSGAPADDLDADTTSPLLEAAAGSFVTRVGAAGVSPEGWYVTLVYTSGDLVVVDAKVTEVLSDTRLRTDHEMPLTLDANSVTWMLRRRELTISSIPGGITLPDTPNGELLLPTDSVHIGGKTDIFVAGAVESASSQIIGLTDENPLARGLQAQTQGGSAGFEDIVNLPDIDDDLFARVTPGMSLVLTAGSDVGAYRIIEIQPTTGMGIPPNVRLDTLMTGTQSTLTWKIVDEIDVDLVSPKDVLLEGSDLILSAGSPLAITASSTNFAAAGVRAGDIVFVDNPDFGGDFTITDATATTLTISPPAPRALGSVRYVVSRRSEGVQRPVLRVSGLELLDSSGAPNGTTIPYRDPVLVLSKGFQNEGAGFLFEGPAALGLITIGLDEIPDVEGFSFQWETRDPARAWGAVLASGDFTFPTMGGVGTVEDMVDGLNADAPLSAAGVRGVALTYAGRYYIGLTSQSLITITGGGVLTPFGWSVGDTNAQVRGTSTSLSYLKVRRGDLIECVGGNNGGRGVRVITEPEEPADRVIVGSGPLGPPGTSALYANAVLSPDPGARIRIARPSVGSARCYFLAPTSVNFAYETTRLTVLLNGQLRTYQPDPENARTLTPPPPSSTLPNTATLNGGSGVLQDLETDFLVAGIREGDLLDVLYRPITGTTPLADPGTIAVGGLTLFVRLDNDPYIQVSFPYPMTRDDLVDYINEQVGLTIASLNAGALELKASRRIELSAGSTALSVLFIATLTSDHPSAGTFIIQDVDQTTLTVAEATPFVAGSPIPATHYRIRRYLQRVSSTEMNLQQDSSGLYYADIEAVSTLPGDYHNIGTDVELTITGYSSDGYRLVSALPELSFSRAEDLRAEISRTLLLVGASDRPVDYVQLNLQNVQVSYERSALADDIQSFCSSRYRRILCEDILVRHLLPHYVSVNWRYSGGPSEPEMIRALVDFLGKIEGGETFEVGSMRDVLTGKQATSVFTADPSVASGRTAPLALIVRHEENRQVRASLARDVVETVRMSTYLPDNLVLRRLSSSGLR